MARAWQGVVLAAAVAIGLVATAAPAYAWHWDRVVQSYQATYPYDAGGYDAYVRIGNGWDSTIYGSARWDAYGEHLRLTYRAGTEMRYRIHTKVGLTIARGTVPVPRDPAGCSLDWGYGSAGGPCQYHRAGVDIREGTTVGIQICIWLDWHLSWYCGTAYGRA
jgi:hypothetical protein